MKAAPQGARPAFDGRVFDREAFLGAGSRASALRRDFRSIVLDYYRSFGRSFPWRESRDPWSILVSEVMLQQTQTDRVIPKYEAFLRVFPRPMDLAEAGLESLLGIWSGLGYNRRALALKKAATAIARDLDGVFPDDEAGLLALPGIGPYTARAVLAFAFGHATPFIETNIRSVFLYHFFPDGESIGDKAVEPLVRAALDQDDPRNWYYALMDYGVWLKKRYGNPNARSAHYARQSPFADSNRRIRGAVLKELGRRQGRMGADELAAILPFSRERVEGAVAELVAEGFLAYGDEELRLSDLGG